MRQAARLLKSNVESGEELENTVNIWACKTLERMSQLSVIEKRLKWTVSGKRSGVAGFPNVEWLRILSFITLAL